MWRERGEVLRAIGPAILGPGKPRGGWEVSIILIAGGVVITVSHGLMQDITEPDPAPGIHITQLSHISRSGLYLTGTLCCLPCALLAISSCCELELWSCNHLVSPVPHPPAQFLSETSSWIRSKTQGAGDYCRIMQQSEQKCWHWRMICVDHDARVQCDSALAWCCPCGAWSCSVQTRSNLDCYCVNDSECQTYSHMYTQPAACSSACDSAHLTQASHGTRPNPPELRGEGGLGRKLGFMREKKPAEFGALYTG